MTATSLPVDRILDQLTATLESQRIAIVDAPPGTGKTTRVPPGLIHADWLGDNRVVLLEPRRVAARAAAERMARDRGETVGEAIGLRTRFETRVGPRTRIEVVTEGVLTRMLLADPSLSGIGALVFDEFHERSIHADTGLAFARETADALRPDLRIVVMSATIDTASLATRLGEPAVIEVTTPSHPITTIYRAPAPGRSPEDEVADAVMDALSAWEGDILVFLAGAGDIRRAEGALRRRVGRDVSLTPLHGSLPAADQDRALAPDHEGRRKVVLSTPIAETSVTIDGVRVVIDTGRRRRPEIDIGRGMTGLRTVSASQAATDQRRGRAGRQAPGVCVRLWPEVDQSRRRLDEPPEILTTDLTALALQIAAWGATDATELPWIDPPPEAALSASRGVLTSLGIIDDSRRLTEHGRRVAEIAAEPRLAHLMVKGADQGQPATACDVAALLSDRDILRGRDRPVDLRVRLDALNRSDLAAEPDTDPFAVRRAREQARRWRRLFDAEGEPVDPDAVGRLLSVAFPDRIAQRRANPGSFLLASGAGASVPPDDLLAGERWLAVAETEGVGADARIVTAAPVDQEELEALHAHRIESGLRGGWDRRARDVVFESQERLGALVLRAKEVSDPDRDDVREALLAGVRREGLAILGWTAADERLRDRLQFLHDVDPDTWPAADDAALLRDLDQWLAPSLGGARRRADLTKINVSEALLSRLDWRRAREVDRLAPTHIVVPSGSRIPVDYRTDPGPALAVRLQEMFGLLETPRIAGGAVPVVVHLLSPAHRPVQVTTDLASFWKDGYDAVRRELRGRYPKHAWPEDPTTAPPTSRAKRRR